MTEVLQRIPLEGAVRVTLDVSGSHLLVNWRDGIDEITVSGQELQADRAGDEIFLRGERRSRGGGRGLFGRLPNISTPGVTIDWGAGESSIEVSDEEGVKIRAGLGGREGSSSNAPIHVDLPTALSVTSIELEGGDLSLSSPTGKVETEVKSGKLRSTGGNAEMTASLGSGQSQFQELAGALNVMGGSGDISISECETITNIKAGSGEVSLVDVRGEAIKIMAGSGDVEVRNCSASAFSCQTGSGDIDLVNGDLDRISVRTGSGDVECTAVFGPYSQSFITGSGSVSLGVPRGLPARFELSTHGGDVDSDVQLVSVGQRGPRSRRRQRLVGSVGSGDPRAEVSVRTASGDIRVHWLAGSAQEPLVVPQPPPAPTPPETPRSPEVPDSPVTPQAPDEQPGTAAGSDPRQQILEALASGVITVEEADALLRKVDGTNAG